MTKTYSIDEYSNEELMILLDLTHPSDRELEAKILMMMSRYENDNDNPNPNPEMYNFFVDVYQRFFQTDGDTESESDILEGFQQSKPSDAKIGNMLISVKKDAPGAPTAPAVPPSSAPSTVPTAAVPPTAPTGAPQLQQQLQH